MTALKTLTKTLTIVTIAGVVALTSAHAQPANGEGYGNGKGMIKCDKGW